MVESTTSQITSGIVLLIIGFVMVTIESNLPLIVNIGWVFFFGGVVVFGLAIYTRIR